MEIDRETRGLDHGQPKRTGAGDARRDAGRDQGAKGGAGGEAGRVRRVPRPEGRHRL